MCSKPLGNFLEGYILLQASGDAVKLYISAFQDTKDHLVDEFVDRAGKIVSKAMAKLVELDLNRSGKFGKGHKRLLLLNNGKT